MKKTMTFAIGALLASSLFVSCGKKAAETSAAPAAQTAAKPAAAAATAAPAAKPAAAAPAATAAPAQAAAPAAAPAAAAPAAKSDEVVFRIANGAEPESIDPALIQGVPEHRIYEALFEGLVEAGKSVMMVPGIPSI